MKSTLALLFILVLPVTAAAQAGGRQVRVFDSVAPPESLDQEIGRAVVIVLGQIESRSQKVLGSPEFPVPAIEHDVRVLQVIKGPSSVRPKSVIKVTQAGGVATVNGVEIVVDDRRFPVFREGQQLVLFLEYHEGWGLVPAFGRASSYPVTKGEVQVPEAARASAARRSAFAGKDRLPLDEFLATIRTRVK
jgi:hypothetical protein